MRAPEKVTIETRGGKVTYSKGETISDVHLARVAHKLGIRGDESVEAFGDAVNRLSEVPEISKTAEALLAEHPEIEPSVIRGSGKGGKITRPDVERAIADRQP